MQVEMPRRVLVLGAGALTSGPAEDLDDSATQALKALKEEGLYTVLVNPNAAILPTPHEFADKVYSLPLTVPFIEQVIAAERVDAIAFAFGGPTALNCCLALARSRVLECHGVRVLGTPLVAIEATEDRQLFVDSLAEIGVRTARRVEEYLGGWKQFEYAVVRDAGDHCLAICSMENVDPIGIRSDESIVVVPAQTLSDQEDQALRDIAIAVTRHLGVIGACNIRYAINPRTRDYRVIEVNARLSRSAALASKATRYPLAYIAAKLTLGCLLPELRNPITRTTSAFVEPALDYVVCKIPRCDVQEREGVDSKSVGGVMAIERNFAEALQEATRMLEIGADGVADSPIVFDDLERAIATPSPVRVFAVAQGFAAGMPLERIAELTSIDPFFLGEIERIVLIGMVLGLFAGWPLHSPEMLVAIDEASRAGFSDRAIAHRLGLPEQDVRDRRADGLVPVLSQIAM